MEQIVKEVADLIEKAVEVIDSEGWVQGNLHSPNEDWVGTAPMSHCMIGGLLKAATGKNAFMEPVADSRYTGAIYLLSKKVDDGSIPRYNDTPGRTWDECRDLMLGVAKDIRNESE